MRALLFFAKGRYNMRTAIYIIAVINVAFGFYILFREKSPFKGKTYKDMAKKAKRDS